MLTAAVVCNQSIDGTSATPLHKAAWNDNDQAALLLLKHGADIHVVDEDGESPAQGASSPALRRLLLHGAAFEREFLALKQEELKPKSMVAWTSCS